MTQWRLVPLLSVNGRLQMAIDWWLLQQHRQGKIPPTLRFYTWSPAAISLGYHQRRYPTFWRELTYQGKPLDLVRRPTGGRAVLHQGDLTYMVVASGFSGKQFEIYQQMCQFLIVGWRHLGVLLHYGGQQGEYIHNPNCFGTATKADLVDSDGNKVIGSALRKQGKAFLQHGSIILSRNNQLYEQVFGECAASSKKMPLGQQENALIPLLIEVFQKAARDCYRIELLTQSLSDNEWKQVVAISKNQEQAIDIYSDEHC